MTRTERDALPNPVHLEVQPREAQSPAAAVAHQLVDLLTSGDLPPGARLPSERSLTERFGVGRSAVREALAALEILGVVDVRPGSGTFLHHTSSELLPRTLSWGMMLAANRTADLLQLRNGLEQFAATLAASHASKKHISALRRHLQQQQASIGQPDAFIDADVRFHVELAAASGNEVLADVLGTLRSMLRVWVDRGVRTTESMTAAFEEHRRIFDAISRHDAVDAASTMAGHMQTASARILAEDE